MQTTDVMNKGLWCKGKRKHHRRYLVGTCEVLPRVVVRSIGCHLGSADVCCSHSLFFGCFGCFAFSVALSTRLCFLAACSCSLSSRARNLFSLSAVALALSAATLASARLPASASSVRSSLLELALLLWNRTKGTSVSVKGCVMCLFILLIVVATARKLEARTPKALNAAESVPNMLSSKMVVAGRCGGGEARRRWLESEDHR